MGVMMLDKTFWLDKTRERLMLAVIAAGVLSLYAAVAFLGGLPGTDNGAVAARFAPANIKLIVQRHLPPKADRDLEAVKLAALYDELGYTTEAVAAGQTPVPRLIASDIPAGLAETRDPELRKSVFIRTLLPIVLLENERVREDRERLDLIMGRMDEGRPISRVNRDWLAEKMTVYEVGSGDVATLKKRMDVVPPSLTIAMAAQETGWGTSRFAREGNALFGQWTWSAAHGILPAERKDGMTHRIKAFETPALAVRDYMLNLNTHRAYAPFRNLRAQARAEGSGLNALALATGLKAYSERGGEYVAAIRGLIRSNALTALDRARLVPRSGAIRL